MKQKQAEMKRINLCFDMRDENQRKVYEYLERTGRKKTAVVVSSLIQTVMSDTYWRNLQMDRDVELCEKFAAVVKSNTAKMDIENLTAMIRDLTERIDNLKVVAVADGTGPAQSQLQSSNAEPEMNDDAFAAMMSFLG